MPTEFEKQQEEVANLYSEKACIKEERSLKWKRDQKRRGLAQKRRRQAEERRELQEKLTLESAGRKTDEHLDLMLRYVHYTQSERSKSPNRHVELGWQEIEYEY